MCVTGALLLYHGLALMISNSYTMGCPPVRGDNPRALVYTTYISVDLAHHEIFGAKVGKGGMISLNHKILATLVTM